MCGIAGHLWHDPDRPAASDVAWGMARALSHRGPDGVRAGAFGNAALGHARLRVIDPAPRADQPLANEDGTVRVVANGEIYNFAGLRARLESRGHVFATRCDAEVIVHLWEEAGEACVHELSGMFAFAVWDSRDRRLFLARDRHGQKPLVYLAENDRFLFASEIKAICEAPGVEVRPDITALHHYLAYQSVPAPWTAFAGISKLPPAHTLTVKDGSVRLRRYWRRTFADKMAAPSSQDLAFEAAERLFKAVRARLVSDVPLGAFLSGGLDSSLVVAMMARCLDEPVRTFSIGFDEPGYDERRFARAVSRHLGTEHREFVVRPDAQAVLPSLVWHYNEPFADPAAIPTWYLCGLAREHVTVALCGDGGDECFAGYPRYFHSRGGVAAALRDMAVRPSRIGMYGSPRLGARGNWSLARRLNRDRLAYYESLAHFSEPVRAGLYTPDMAAACAGTPAVALILSRYGESDARNFLDATLDTDLGLYLPDTLNTKVDVASMAHGLEVRAPFQDHELVSFAARVPAERKLTRDGETKHLLKLAAGPYLPCEIVHRPKMGFSVPLDQWFRGRLREMLCDTILSPRAMSRGYFRRDFVERLVLSHMEGENRQYLLYNLLMLEMWHLMFVDRVLSPPRPETAR